MTKDEKRQNILEAVGEMTGKLLDATTASIEVRFKKRSVNVAPIAIQETLARVSGARVLLCVVVSIHQGLLCGQSYKKLTRLVTFAATLAACKADAGVLSASKPV